MPPSGRHNQKLGIGNLVVDNLIAGLYHLVIICLETSPSRDCHLTMMVSFLLSVIAMKENMFRGKHGLLFHGVSQRGIQNTFQLASLPAGFQPAFFNSLIQTHPKSA